MPNSVDKSTTKSIDIQQELELMRQSLRMIRDRVNADLDAMVEQIDKMLPPEDTARSRRMKKYTKKDWERFLA